MAQQYFEDDCMYFIISDLHGQGKIYDYIVNHLDQETIAKGRRIKLIINGDIIDRGPESIRMLIDIMERSKARKGNIDVTILPGNHEEMMFAALNYYKNHGCWDRGPGYTTNNLWFHPANHGLKTCEEFFQLPPDTQKELFNFLKELPLYCVLKTKKPGNNSYVIVHANPPSNALTETTIPTLGMVVTDERFNFLRECLIYRKPDNSSDKVSLPDEGVITIIGHTPVMNDNGFSVCENGKLLMIDGGCAFMADNPDSDNIIMKEMATLVKLSDVPGKTEVGIYGNQLQKNLRQGAKI